MKVTLLSLGKTDEAYAKSGIELYRSKLKHYCRLEMTELPGPRHASGLDARAYRQKEAVILTEKWPRADLHILLDEKGRELSSVEFAGFLQEKANQGKSHLAFVIGGPFGFDEEIRQKASGVISLSRMTFNHQMVRLIFLEQLYRAFTILKNEPYHNP